jgi:citrate lyase beta subunit
MAFQHDSIHLEQTRLYRSLLFTPANRPTAFAKSLAAGADLTCLDLEDAVPPDQKEAARAPAIAFLSEGPNAGRGVRINGLRTAFGLSDLLAVAQAAPTHGFLLLPKVDAVADVQIVSEILAAAGSGLFLGAIIESAAGLEAVFEIARAGPRLAFLMFGGVDLSAELGVDGSDASLAYARGRVVHAGRVAGIDVMDVPALAFRDPDAVTGAARRAKAHGFSGKAAIHPINIAPIHDVFTPTPAEIEEAHEIVAAFDNAVSGLVVIDGKLIEAPVIRGMRARLAAGRAAGVC